MIAPRLGCHSTHSDSISVKFGAHNISIAKLLFPRRLQLNCSRKLTGNLTRFVLHFYRVFLKLFRSYRTHAQGSTLTLKSWRPWGSQHIISRSPKKNLGALRPKKKNCFRSPRASLSNLRVNGFFFLNLKNVFCFF